MSIPTQLMWSPALGVPSHLPAGPRILCCAQDLCKDKLSLGDSRAERATGERGAWQAGKHRVALR